MSLLLASLVVLAFAVATELLGLPSRAREVAHRGRECVHVLRDPSLDDRAKERALQAEALQLFRLSLLLVLGGVSALLLPLGAVWLLDATGVGSFDGVLLVLQRLDFLGVVLLAGLVVYALIPRLRGP